MRLIRVLFIVFASLLVDAAGSIALASATETIEELQEAEASRHRRGNGVRPYRPAAKSPFATGVSAALRRPQVPRVVRHRSTPGPRIVKAPPLVADSPATPEDH